MGFTLTIEGDEKLFYGEDIIRVAQMSLTSPNDSRARSTKNYITVNIIGKLHADASGGGNSETLKIFKWAQVPAEDEKAYRTVTIEVISENKCFRQIVMSKAFVIDYNERYTDSRGIGEFALNIRQKADMVDDVQVEGGFPASGDFADAIGSGGGVMEKLGQAVVKTAKQKVISKADSSGMVSGVMQNMQG
ncbi:hypothetical protein [Anaerosinus massiliensis]|uniref:hypothetical protein n=1 Tax=Massilibacillus massiliensis TaxID=1806837 RepID=UPI000DA61E21|nr:hypothetical protein [Massilibacillus massiliensis]